MRSTSATSFLDSIGPNATFHVVNLGCKVNRVESDTISASLISRGCVPGSLENADVIVVNTCTVTGEADKKARKAVRHALSKAPDALVYVTGCAVAIDPDTYRALGGRVQVVQRTDLLAALDTSNGADALRLGEGFRTRVSIKAQDGCNRACTYCIVHVARGPAKSVPSSAILEEARKYLVSGTKELVLAGIDLGSYHEGDMRLENLVTELLELADRTSLPGTTTARVRASSIEPQSITPALIDLLASSEGRLCRHLHLPLQSGSTKVLKEMARPYTAKQFEELIDELYERVPSISLTTDIICGFPGESDDEFEETIELARRCRFSKIHVFPYSRREGTPAAARADQVDATVKSERAQRLRALSDDLRRDDISRRKGTVELALIEDAIALTESYHERAVPDNAAIGDLVPLVL